MVSRALAACASLALLCSCRTSAPPTEAEVAAYTESLPPVGETVAYVVYTHCGVEGTRLGGRWWQAADPLHGSEGPGTTPQGWGDPYQAGELTLHSERSATFRAEGDAVEFVPADDDHPGWTCR
jgi:hypothetical protein